MSSIKGLQKTTLVDFPSHVACTIFISGCNFKCGFCYNPELVNDSSELKEISEAEIFEFLDKRKNVLSGVCITGGEPTLYKNLKNFIMKIKEKGYKVKLDTNGAAPEVLKELIDGGLVDYIAMDIKTSKEKYDKAANVKVDIDRITQSIDIIKNSNIDYEFRTTVIPEFFTEKDAIQIGGWLKGSKKFCLQQFVLRKTLDPKFMKTKPYDISELEKLRKVMEPYFDKVELRA